MPLGWAALISVAFGFLTWDQVNQDQELSAAVREEFGDMTEAAMEDLLTIPGLLPSFTYNGQTFGGTGQTGLTSVEATGVDRDLIGTSSAIPNFNLDEIFTLGQDELNYFDENYPTDLVIPDVDIGLANTEADIASLINDAIGGIESAESLSLDRSAEGLASGLSGLAGAGTSISDIIGSTGTDISAILGGAQVTPEQLLEGVEMPDTDLSDVLSGRLAGIGATSQSRQELQQQELAAGGAALGGLENLSAQSRSLAFEEGSARGLEASTATAQTRAEELAAQTFVSNLQAQAASQSAEIGASLATTEATSASDLAGLQIKSVETLGLAAADLEATFGLADIGTIDAAADAVADLNTFQAQSLLDSAGIRLEEAQLQNLIDEGNRETELGEFEQGLDLAGGPARDEIMQFTQALGAYMANLGVSQEVFDSILQATNEFGAVTSGQMDNTITDYFSFLQGAQDTALGLNAPYGG